MKPWILLLICSPLLAWTETLPRQLDLETAERLAMEHAPLLRAARARTEALEAVPGELRTLARPRLQAEAGASFDGNPNSFGGGSGGDRESWQAGLRLDVPISSFGRVPARLRSAEAAAAEAAFLEIRDQSTLRLAVREAFFRAQFADQAVKVQSAAVEVLTVQVQDNEARLEAGAITRLPLLQSRVALENGRTALLRARRDRALAVESLRTLLGLPYPPGAGPDDIQLPETWPDLAFTPRDTEDALTLALARRPEFLALEEALRAQEAMREFARLALRPDVSGFATAGVENERFGEDAVRDTWMVGVQFVLPLYDAGQRDSRVRQAEAQLRSLQAQRDQLVLDVENDLRQSLTGLSLAEALAEASATLVEQAEEALRLSMEAQANGRATQLEVSVAELDRTQARLEALRAEQDQLQAKARILFVIGE